MDRIIKTPHSRYEYLRGIMLKTPMQMMPTKDFRFNFRS